MQHNSNPTNPGYYPSRFDVQDWLPTTVKEAKGRGWNYLDVILFSGDAYVDHPSFGIAAIGRALASLNLKVAIVPQPNWQDDLRDFKKFGPPRLFFGVTSGNMDSMVNHYTARKRLRSTDAYTPGNVSGFRPDRATSVYAQILRKLYPESVIIAGGIEASQRRLTHYDFWADKLMPGLVHDQSIDLIVYGMGETTIRKIALGLLEGKKLSELSRTPQICFLAKKEDPCHQELINESLHLHSHETCLREKKSFAENFRHIEEVSNSTHPRVLTQQVHNETIIINPPELLPDQTGLDPVYSYPYTRLPHPKYWKKPLIPAFEMIRFSVNIHRGCFGGCAFCTISTHQGKFIQSRSEESILRELKQITQMPGFKGYVSDLGGPSANMYRMKGKKQQICDLCQRPSCIHPGICNNLDTNHKPLLELYRKAKSLPGIKKVFIGSGVRYDLLVQNLDDSTSDSFRYAEELIKDHVSGRLKVAPEHTHTHVLKLMRKPDFNQFKKFKKLFDRINEKYNLKQQLIPYFISAHPGCSIEDMAELAAETKELNFKLQQVQDFTPTPMTLATVMFYTGLHPYSEKPIQVETHPEKKLAMSKFFFWYKKEERSLIRKTLRDIDRLDLSKKLGV